ncbi:right-handed parallel beta-helix repeat-containing protein [bacterium]|nr:right-handed parallel beta-helix repeat-containing protein [bacterium]MBU1918653.1 right-handed parallel beta-helix repeat-containing protein [bacterium]
METRKILLIILTGVFMLPFATFASERIVTNTADDMGNGTVRKILQDACDEAGNDTISFAIIDSPETRVELLAPLVILEDCLGTITFEGSDDVDVVLDGAQVNGGGGVAGDDCTFHVYTDNNHISKLSFVGNNSGAGICLFGRNNTIEYNRFGMTYTGAVDTNLYGVVVSDAFSETYSGVDGSGNIVQNNDFGPNNQNAIYVDANEVTIQDNTITDAGTDGIWLRCSDSVVRHNDVVSSGRCLSDYDLYDSSTCPGTYEGYGVGIVVADESSNVIIGGENFYSDKNNIQNNANGGVWVLGESTENITITHNSIGSNYGTGLDIDLGGDHVTVNDWLDEDYGANTFLNTIAHFQVFELVNSAGGEARYFSWGAAPRATRVELYTLSQTDIDDNVFYGGGMDFVGDFTPVNNAFSVLPNTYSFSEGSMITALAFDEAGNTSEYSVNVEVGEDADMDGILDVYELGDGTEGSEGTSPNSADSDGDGLPDGVEDKNRNGVWDDDETCAYNPDSDEDGVGDYFETHGDGSFLEANDSNPLLADTDADGLEDGEEDLNGNGKWEAYLGETNPLLTDSDDDGFADHVDTCPHIRNVGQNDWYCETNNGNGRPFKDNPFQKGNFNKGDFQKGTQGPGLKEGVLQPFNNNTTTTRKTGTFRSAQ